MVEILDRLASKLSGELLRVKVDEENLLMQALSIYKDPKAYFITTYLRLSGILS